MYKRLFMSIMLITLGLTNTLAGEKEKYQQLAELVKEEVWSKDLPAFRQRSCPDEYKQYSAVTLAFYNELTVDQHLRAKFLEILFFGYTAQMVTANNCSRQLVAINDEKAREEYSEFDFSTIQRSGMHKRQTIVGVRVIKASGEVREINADDYVIIDEGRSGREQRRKLAVPDLQVGDLIDFFYYTIDDLVERSVNPYEFNLISQTPTLHYQAHCVIDREMTTQYRSLNGAPAFKESTDDNGNIVLDLEQSDLKLTEPELWYNHAEQTPRILLYITGKKLKGQWTAPSTKQKGLQANPHFSIIVDDDVNYREKAHFGNGLSKYPLLGKDMKEWQQYCDRIAAMNLTKEERVARLYTGLHYQLRFSKSGLLNSGGFLLMLKEALQKQGITAHDVYTTDNQHEPIDQLISYANTTWGLYLQSIDKVLLPPVYDMSPFTIPAALQGRSAILDGGDGTIISLPKSEVEDNTSDIAIRATIDGTSLQIDRRTSMTGAERERILAKLYTAEQIMDEAFRYMGINRTMTELVGKKYRDDLEESIRQQQAEKQKLFATEASVYHAIDITAPTNCKVESIGFREDSAAFVYSSSYTVVGLVKRAGPNLILSIGNLIGQQMKIEGSNRERTADIHYDLPACQSHHDITVLLPEGYTADSVSLSQLNKSVSNSCGAFITQATTNGTELKLTVTKRYNHAQEPLEKWPEVLAFIDAASDFNTAQLILRHE